MGSIKTSCEVCAANMSECAGKEPEPEPEPIGTEQPVEEPKEDSGLGAVLFIVTMLAAGGGTAFYLLVIRKEKPQTKGSDDLNDYDYSEDEDDDEDYEHEDGTDAEDERL